MAACKTCGQKAGAFREECKPCEAERAQIQAQKAAEWAKLDREERARREAQNKRELEERTVTFIDASIDSMRQALKEGRTPYLHTTLFLTTEFIINGEVNGSPPDLHDLDSLGRDGWEIVTTIPQTLGMGLTNVYKSGGQNWGGGLGGMVTGIYVVARLPITEATLTARETMIREVLLNRYEDGRSKSAKGPQIPLLANGVDKQGSVPPLAAVAATALAVSMTVDAMDASGDDGAGDGGFGDFDF
jgi:hypothetical protein